MIRNPLKHLVIATGVLVATALIQPVQAQTTYNDATGEEFTGNTFLDIASVEVSNSSFDLIFKITVVGDPVATDWGKYLIGFNTGAGGDTTNNGWGRPIAIGDGMDFWAGTWVDGGNGGELYEYDGAFWNLISSPGVSKTTNSITVNVPFVPMGLSAGDSFGFDVYTSGGGGTDGAIDALGNPAQTIADWGDFYDSGSNTNAYTIAAVADPTNQITFLCDMEVPIALYDADFTDPNGFAPNSDILYVRGDFNGWQTSSNLVLVQVGSSSLYSNTLDVVAAAGSTINYKFFGDTFPGEEDVLLSCNATRQLEITSQTLTAPLAYWGDQQLTDPDRQVAFSVDMSYQETLGSFTNGVSEVFLRGSMSGVGWDPGVQMTNGPAPDTNIFTTVLTYPYTPTNGCVSGQYKFFSAGVGGGWESPQSTGGGNRSFSLESAEQTIPTVFWNDVDPNNFDPCEVVNAETMVTFSIDMEGVTNVTYTGTETVYVNGDFLGWWGWGAPGPAEYALTKNPTSDVHSITLSLPASQQFRLEYKYSVGGSDNEGGFGNNHVRYIRSDTEGASYALPQDIFIGSNPGVDVTEDELGSLSIANTGGGNASLSWEGLPCTMMQSASTIDGLWNDAFEARGVQSTNISAGATQQYFRLQRP